MPSWDVVIVGAGCAGLSLAAHLVDAGVTARRRVLLVDDRTTFLHDRTFCFWTLDSRPFDGSSSAPPLFSDAVRARWSAWSVRARGETITRSHSGIEYAYVPGEAFYEAALARLRRAGSGVELRLGVRVHDVRDMGNAVTLATSEGTVQAALVFDSRVVAEPREGAAGRGRADDGRANGAPAPGGRGDAGPPEGVAGETTSSRRHVRLLQHFRGHVVQAPRPVFDPTVAMLMDFDVRQDHGIHFLYVLPFDAQRALVESTLFSEAVVPETVYEDAIADYLRGRFGLDGWTVLHREGGVVPMTTAPFPMRPSPRVVRIGLAGGFARPSTGYAFATAQRWSKVMAERLARAQDGEIPPPPPARPARYAAIDATFLSVLRRAPERAPDLFARLFARVPPASLVRFLSDVSTVADDVRVMTRSPMLTMTLESARAAPLWLRP